MTRFALQFDPAEIAALAARFPPTDDRPAAAAGAAAREQGHYTRDQFLLVCAWKTPRSRPRVAANEEATVRFATRAALTATDERARMEALLALDGVGVPTASTLLHFAAPDRYPILDVRALASLGEAPRSTYTTASPAGTCSVRSKAASSARSGPRHDRARAWRGARSATGP